MSIEIKQNFKNETGQPSPLSPYSFQQGGGRSQNAARQTKYRIKARAPVNKHGRNIKLRMLCNCRVKAIRFFADQPSNSNL